MKTLEQEFLEAFENHADAIFRYCFVRLGERERAKDAVQETYYRAWEWLASGNRARNLRALLYRTAHNLAVDELRRVRPESLDAMTEKGFDVPDRAVADPMTLARVSEALALANRLEPAYRDVLLMRHVEGMSVKDIAAVTDERENAVSVRIHRAIAKLRELRNHD